MSSFLYTVKLHALKGSNVEVQRKKRGENIINTDMYKCLLLKCRNCFKQMHSIVIINVSSSYI